MRKKSNRRVIVALLILVIAVWVNLFFRVGNLLNENEIASDEPQFNEEVHQEILDMPSWRFQGCYRDPFQGKPSETKLVNDMRASADLSDVVTKSFHVSGEFGQSIIINRNGSLFFLEVGDTGFWGTYIGKVGDSHCFCMSQDSLFFDINEEHFLTE